MDDAFVEPEALQQCVAILTEGYVQSYVDFFYLAHREQEQEETAGLDLALVSDKLTEAEKSRRSGNPNAVFDNYELLAAYFAEKGAHQTSVHFFEKCLQLSRLVGDIESEKRALSQLGLALSHISGKTEEAITCHETHLRLASESRDEPGVEAARAQLAVMYDRRALELEATDLQKSVVFLEKLLKMAADNNDMDKKALANFRIGKAFNKLKKPERAIVALTQSLEHAQQSKNSKAQGESCAALADAYLLIESKTTRAIDYLQKTRQIAKQNGDDEVQSRACRMLGCVFTQAGELDQAVHFYEQNFELVRKQAKIGDVDRARVLLGVSLKNARHAEFRKMIHAPSLKGLLAWKVSREFHA